MNIFSNDLKKIFGKNLFIQKYPTVRFHLQNDISTTLTPHIEIHSGHSPYTFNLWYPFHEVVDESGIWISDLRSSLKFIK